MANGTKWVDINTLSQLISLIKTALNGKISVTSGKDLSTNDYDNTEKSHVSSAYVHSQSAHAAVDAEKNNINIIQRNGTILTPDSNRIVNIEVPTKVSDITNDTGYLTEQTVADKASVITYSETAEYEQGTIGKAINELYHGIGASEEINQALDAVEAAMIEIAAAKEAAEAAQAAAEEARDAASAIAGFDAMTASDIDSIINGYGEEKDNG